MSLSASSSPHERGGLDLARMRAGGVDPLVERRRRAAERLEAHGRRAHRGPPEHLGVVHQQRQHRGLGLRAVDEREPFLRREAERREPGGRQRGGGRRAPPRLEHLPLAHQDQRHVTQRRQVAAGADAALLRHQRHEAGVEQAEQRLDQGGAHAAGRAEQDVGAQHHQPANDVGRQRRARPRRRGSGSG